MGWRRLFLNGCSRDVLGRVPVFADGGVSLAGTGGRDHVVRLARSDNQRLCNPTGPGVGHLLGVRTERPFISVRERDSDFATYQINLLYCTSGRTVIILTSHYGSALSADSPPVPTPRSVHLSNPPLLQHSPPPPCRHLYLRCIALAPPHVQCNRRTPPLPAPLIVPRSFPLPPCSFSRALDV